MLKTIEKTYAQDYDSLVAKCKSEKSLFEDFFDFGNVKKMLVDEKYISSKQKVQWLRPHEIFQRSFQHIYGSSIKYDDKKNTPMMYIDRPSRFDINQGYLGNCYFLTALSQISDDQWAFDRVVPPGQTFDKDNGYVGVFRFRFYRFGKWEEIIIDDRLPVNNGTLLFAESESIYVFWPSLVEKAFAKFNGSYLDINKGGNSSDAAVALTGGISYKTKTTFIATDQLPSKLIKYHKEYTMTFANIDSIDETKQKNLTNLGLQPGHAYAITGILKVGDINLIRVRNPHGKLGNEWIGEWSDGSPEWSDVKLDNVTYKHKIANDGEFCMSCKDFNKYFTSIELLFMKPSKSKFDLFEWIESHAAPFDEFTKGNPTIKFSLHNPNETEHEKKKCFIIASLAHRNPTYPHYSIYKWNTSEHKWNQKNIDMEKQMYYYKTFDFSNRMELEEGDYTIIPRHYIRGNIGQEAEYVMAGKKEEFHLRLLVESNWGSTDNWKKYVILSMSVHLKKPNFFHIISSISVYLIIKEQHYQHVLYQSEKKEIGAQESNSNTDGGHDAKYEWIPCNFTFPDLLSKCTFEVHQQKSICYMKTQDILIGQFEASLDDLKLQKQFTLSDSEGNNSGTINIKSLDISKHEEKRLQSIGDESSPERSAHYIIN